MRKLLINCDCCGAEIEEDMVFAFEYYIHVSPTYNHMAGHVKVVNGQSFSISKRMERKEFCLPCYNEIIPNVFENINKIRASKNLNE